MLEDKYYKIIKIEGEYATLKRTDKEEEDLFIALALLPFGVDIDTKLLWKNLEYTVLD